jgi:hypothetical protein
MARSPIQAGACRHRGLLTGDGDNVDSDVVKGGGGGASLRLIVLGGRRASSLGNWGSS